MLLDHQEKLKSEVTVPNLITYLWAIYVMDVLVTYGIAEDFVVGSIIGCKVRDRWLKLEHKRDVYQSKQQNSKTKIII